MSAGSWSAGSTGRHRGKSRHKARRTVTFHLLILTHGHARKACQGGEDLGEPHLELERLRPLRAVEGLSVDKRSELSERACIAVFPAIMGLFMVVAGLSRQFSDGCSRLLPMEARQGGADGKFLGLRRIARG